MKNNITIFALSSNQDLANSIADILGTKVGKCDVHHFADGEILVEIGESVSCLLYTSTFILQYLLFLIESFYQS